MKEKIKKFFEEHEILCDIATGVLVIVGSCFASFKVGRGLGRKEMAYRIDMKSAKDNLLNSINAYTDGYANGFKDAYDVKENNNEL